MNPQIFAGMWFYIDEKPDVPFYLGHMNALTACMLRKIEMNGKEYTDSYHTLYSNLKGIPLTEEILKESFGFMISYKEAHVVKEIKDGVKVLRGDRWEEVKPKTFLYIETEAGKRKNVFLQCGENKIYLSEITYVHELQLLILSLTYNFPIITIKTKTDATTNGAVSGVTE